MKKTLAALAATVAVAVTGGTASAATTTPSTTTVHALVNRVDDAPNPKAAFNALSATDKKLFTEAAHALVNRVDDAPNPKAALNTLSPTDKKLFKDIVTPYGAPDMVSAKLPQSITNSLFTGCWSHWDQVVNKNVLGWVLTKGSQETHICAFNNIVYKVWVDNPDSAAYWTWSAHGWNITTDNAYWEGRGAVRFIFEEDATPGQATLCERIFVNGNGYNWRTDHTCPASA
jgi:hypothetical protein